MISSTTERRGYNYTNHNPSILTQRINETKSMELQEDNEALSLKSMEYCSRFKICSSPKCPLDILIDMRDSVDDDPKCGMAKATRHKYWESMEPDTKSLLPFQVRVQPSEVIPVYT